MSKTNGRGKYLLKNIGVLTIGNMSSKILSFLLVPLYTRTVMASELGVFDLIQTATQLLFPLLTLDISAGVLRYALDQDTHNEEIVPVAVRLFGISTLIVSVITIIIWRLSLIPELAGQEWILIVYYMTYATNQMMVAYGKGIEKMKEVVIGGCFGSISVFILACWFLAVMRLGMPGILYASLLGQLVTTLYYLGAFAGTVAAPTRRNLQFEHQVIAYSLPLVIVDIAWWVNSASDRYIVAWLMGTSATGILAASYKIPTIINVLQQIFIQAWHISGIKEYGDRDKSLFYSRVYCYMNTGLVTACFLLILGGKILSGTLFANEFSDAWRYTPFLLISGVINASSGFLGTILAAQKESRRMAISGMVGAIVNIVLNIVLVFIIGLQGAAVATAVSSFLIFIVRYSSTRNELEQTEVIRGVVSWLLLSVMAILVIYEQSRLWQAVVLLIVSGLMTHGVISFNNRR